MCDNSNVLPLSQRPRNNTDFCWTLFFSSSSRRTEIKVTVVSKKENTGLARGGMKCEVQLKVQLKFLRKLTLDLHVVHGRNRHKSLFGKFQPHYFYKSCYCDSSVLHAHSQFVEFGLIESKPMHKFGKAVTAYTNMEGLKVRTFNMQNKTYFYCSTKIHTMSHYPDKFQVGYIAAKVGTCTTSQYGSCCSFNMLPLYLASIKMVYLLVN